MNEVRQIEPMLARLLPSEKLEPLLRRPDVVAEEKLNGERNLLHIQPDGSAVITSRRVSKVTGRFAEKSEHVPHLTMPGTWPQELAGTILDTEMIHPKGFKMSSSIFRSLAPRAVAMQEEQGRIECCVFDVLFVQGRSMMNKTWKERRRWLEDTFSPSMLWPKEMFMSRVVTEDKEQFLYEVWERGGEGIMLKPVDALYLPGARNVWVKVKHTMTVDVVVLGFVEPDMAYTGKYVETWPFWAVRGDYGEWVKLDREKAMKYAREGHEVMPVNSSWWKGWLAGMQYGQFVSQSVWRQMGCPESYRTIVKNGEKYELVRMGQTGPGDEEMIVEVTRNRDKYLGKVMEVKANERFPTGKLQHPVFLRWRDDKNPEDCVWDGKTR